MSGAHCVGFMYSVCRSVTPLSVVRKNRLLPWSVPAQCWLHVGQSHPLVSRLSHRSVSFWSVPADNFMSVCHIGQCRPGQCQMMSHRSVSSWSVPADNFRSVCHTGQCRPGQCQMMSHRSVSSWSVPDDVTPDSIALLLASCRPHPWSVQM